MIRFWIVCSRVLEILWRDRFAAAAPLGKWIFAKRLRPAQLFAYGARVRHFVFRWMVTTIAVMVASAFIRGHPLRQPGEPDRRGAVAWHPECFRSSRAAHPERAAHFAYAWDYSSSS